MNEKSGLMQKVPEEIDEDSEKELEAAGWKGSVDRLAPLGPLTRGPRCRNDTRSGGGGSGGAAAETKEETSLMEARWGAMSGNERGKWRRYGGRSRPSNHLCACRLKRESVWIIGVQRKKSKVEKVRPRGG